MDYFVRYLPCTDGTVSQVPEDGLKEGWQLKFMIDDRCAALCLTIQTPLSVVILKEPTLFRHGFCRVVQMYVVSVHTRNT